MGRGIRDTQSQLKDVNKLLKLDPNNTELMPLADFRQELSAGLNIYINRPLSMKPEDAAEEIKVEQMNELKREINDKILKFITTYMWTESSQFKHWDDAYKFSGRNSTYYRSEKVNKILEFAAPHIDNFAYNLTDIQKDYIMVVFKY